MAIELTDIVSISSILIFLVLIGYLIGEYFDLGYLGKPYRPKGGDLDKFLKYFSMGTILIILVSLIALGLLLPLIAPLASSFHLDIPTIYVSIIISLIYLGLLAVGITLMPSIGKGFRKLKNINPIEITIEISEMWNIDAKEIYDEDEDYLYYIDKNENWGMIRKNLVKKVTSRKKKGKPLWRPSFDWLRSRITGLLH